MDIKPLTNVLALSGQIRLADVKLFADQGYKTLINNRPDGEVPRQPRSETLGNRAAEFGISYHYIPITPGQITAANVTAMKEFWRMIPAKR